MTKKNNSAAAAKPTTPPAPGKATGEPTGKRVTFPHDQRKIDMVRIRQHLFLECDIDPEEIEAKVAESGVEYEITSSEQWFIIWVKA